MSNALNTPVSICLLIALMVSLSACRDDEDSKSTAENEKIEYDCSSAETMAKLEKQAVPWALSATSQSGRVSIDFSCEAEPFVGDFQACEIQLTENKRPQYADTISIDGGMKAHGHGLPTVPTLSPTAKKGHYKIEGLKYSMPGAWTVGFLVNIGGQSDTVIFDFEI